MIPDTYITDKRLRVVRDLPWVMPAGVLLGFTDEDLDNLAAVHHDLDACWHTLSAVALRIQGTEAL